jgi:hypothetical protein
LEFFLKKNVGSKPLRRTSVKVQPQGKHEGHVRPTESDRIQSAETKMEG